MIVDCISDLHGYYPKLEGGDLLIVAGDLTASDKQSQYLVFREWIRSQDYRKKIFICGNHDNCIEQGTFYFNEEWMGATHLRDEAIEFEGLKIWGSPWTCAFEGMNPHCKAFTVETDKELKRKWDLIPEDTDILITHEPPLGFMDQVDRVTKWGTKQFNVGSSSLYDKLYGQWVRPKLHVFGHVHEGYGHISKILDMPGTQMVNASHVNEVYEPVNKPIRIEL